MTKSELKTAPISIRVRPSLKAGLQQLADEHRRPFAQYIEVILEDHVNAEMNSTQAPKSAKPKKT